VRAECGVESPPDAADWRAYLDDDGVAVTFCPECATLRVRRGVRTVIDRLLNERQRVDAR
jgi:hypothetical protein